MNPVNNGEKTIAIEMYFKDYLLWHKAVISIAHAGMHIESYSTKKIIIR